MMSTPSRRNNYPPPPCSLTCWWTCAMSGNRCRSVGRSRRFCASIGDGKTRGTQHAIPRRRRARRCPLRRPWTLATAATAAAREKIRRAAGRGAARTPDRVSPAPHWRGRRRTSTAPFRGFPSPTRKSGRPRRRRWR